MQPLRYSTDLSPESWIEVLFDYKGKVTKYLNRLTSS